MGMYLFCQPTENNRVWGWESSCSTWHNFVTRLIDHEAMSDEVVTSMVMMGSLNPTFPADLVPQLRADLIAARPTLGYGKDTYESIWVDRLIKCCNVAIANKIGLDSWW